MSVFLQLPGIKFMLCANRNQLQSEHHRGHRKHRAALRSPRQQGCGCREDTGSCPECAGDCEGFTSLREKLVFPNSFSFMSNPVAPCKWSHTIIEIRNYMVILRGLWFSMLAFFFVFSHLHTNKTFSHLLKMCPLLYYKTALFKQFTYMYVCILQMQYVGIGRLQNKKCNFLLKANGEHQITTANCQ